MADRVHILVLNHNGRALLEECLPSVVACARTSIAACRVTVIDNDSTDGSAELLHERWPGVDVIRMSNRGLVSFNDAVRRVDEPVVVLLNNDVKLASGCVDRLAETFEQNADCFLAGPLCWGLDGRYEGTCSELCFRRGLVHTRLRADAPHRAASGPAYTASAGAVLAVSRERFLALGGFDPLFLPGRFEDLDLAFRGWLAGWRAYYVPEAVAYHKGRATFGPRFGGRAGEELDARNALLFAWKNLREPPHVAVHLACLVLRLARALATGQGSFLRACAGAARRLPDVIRRRAAANDHVRSERELFRLLGTAGVADESIPQ